MGNKSKRGPKKKKKPPSLAVVGDDKDDSSPPKETKVRPLPPDKKAEWLIAEAEQDTLAQKKTVNGLEQQLLERDETILGLRKEIVILRKAALHEEEIESHSKNKALLAGLELKEGECVMKIGGQLAIGPTSMVEKKEGE